MIFNSYIFLFGFVPVVLVALWLLDRAQASVSVRIVFLAVATLVFYGWNKPVLVVLLLGSVLFNFAAAFLVRPEGAAGQHRKSVLAAAITANVAALGYFKYTGFLLQIVNDLAGSSFNVGHILWPIGISFFTFQQIAYLVDSYRGAVKEHRLVPYLGFVAFFPYVLAGPIPLQSEILPQYGRKGAVSPGVSTLVVGGTIFAIGLFKKVFIADALAVHADPLFAAASLGVSASFFEAWGGAIAYTCQLYFDFSGYSDMAVGLCYMVGIRLPANFMSPYRATSIVIFWQRWHMTLTRFLTAYIYNPLAVPCTRWAMTREFGRGATFLIGVGGPTLATFLLAGLWHGAGWTFVAFGAVHGGALVIAQSWRQFRMPRLPSWLGWGLTMTTVTISLVFFRAPDLTSALSILAAMAGTTVIAFPTGLELFLAAPLSVLQSLGADILFTGNGFFYQGLFHGVLRGTGFIVLAFGIILLMPNTVQLMRRYAPVV